jgi:hypothetical protein
MFNGFRNVLNFQIRSDVRLFMLGQRCTHADQTSVRGLRDPRLAKVGHRRTKRHTVHPLQCCALRGYVVAHDLQVVDTHVRPSSLVWLLRRLATGEQSHGCGHEEPARGVSSSPHASSV